MGRSKLADIIYNIAIEDINLMVKNAYHARYNGTWANTAHFEFKGSHLQLVAPPYTRFMLYGRPAGKMPPEAPIKDWMSRYHIRGNSWAIRMNIAKYGTKDYGKPYSNRNFLRDVYPEVEKTISDKLGKRINLELTEILNQMFH